MSIKEKNIESPNAQERPIILSHLMNFMNGFIKNFANII